MKKEGGMAGCGGCVLRGDEVGRLRALGRGAGNNFLGIFLAVFRVHAGLASERARGGGARDTYRVGSV